MDVRLSPEQRALQDSAAAVVERLGPHTVRDLDGAERRAKLDAAVEASGWRELRAAADGSAPLASAVEAAVVAEQLGRGLADVPFLGPTLAADLRRRAGGPPATEAETVALRPDLSRLATVADEAAVGFDATDSGWAIWLSESGGAYALVGAALPVAAPCPDLTRRTALFDGGMAASRVADGFLGDDDVTAWSALGLALSCADLVGIMNGVTALATAYATSRRQYGVPVGSFQAVQHLLADAHVATEGSRSVTLHAAWAVDALEPSEALAAASVAKAYCARAARAVCEAGIQVHGGMGNTWDCLAHAYLRRALTSIDLLGGVGPSLARVIAHRGIGGDDGLR